MAKELMLMASMRTFMSLTLDHYQRQMKLDL